MSSRLSASSRCLCAQICLRSCLLKDQGWNDDGNEGWDRGGAVGYGNGLVRALASYNLVHIF